MAITLNGSTGITDADGGTVLNTNDFASQAQAQAGTDNTTVMTPLRSAQAITAQVGVANSVPVAAAMNASGSAPIYACRAWARWNASGTIAASGNVSSVTVVGTGNFTVNFTTAMPDANYAVTGSAGDTDVAGAEFVAYFPSTRIGASSVGMRTDSGGGAPFSAAANSISIFR